MKKTIAVFLSIVFFAQSLIASISVTPYGAAEIVSGSSFLISTDRFSAIVDCGSFMEEEQFFYNKNFEMTQELINAQALILTHIHSDHLNKTPLLFAEGFRGKVYSTKTTKDLALRFFREGRGFEYIKRKYFWDEGKTALHWRKEHSKAIARLKTTQDPKTIGELSGTYKKSFYLCRTCLRYEVGDIEKHFEVLSYNKKEKLFNNFYITLVDAKHIPGSASVLFEIDGKKILFSGDLGSGFSKLIGQAQAAPKADYIFMETTNGAENFLDMSGFESFHKDLSKAVSDGKTVWIPALSFDRTQKVLYELKIMQDDGELSKDIPIYSISPSANKINELYQQEAGAGRGNWFVKEVYKKGGVLPKNLSLKAPKVLGNIILLSSSGDMDMGTSATIAERLVGRADVFIMIVNYVSPNSLAGQLLDENNEKYKDAKVDIKQYHIFSAHPDLNGILKWLSKQNKNVHIYLIHGQKDDIEKVKDTLQKRGQTNINIAEMGKRIEI
ncbi:MAG: MBL fold metallo-hydrolase [Elusimicrobiota bacterium]|jgi:metallo-beta-lactamase family protein|nr:MBL fold metallo-hydrolase [Elusimicrobiota bacterium]